MATHSADHSRGRRTPCRQRFDTRARHPSSPTQALARGSLRTTAAKNPRAPSAAASRCNSWRRDGGAARLTQQAQHPRLLRIRPPCVLAAAGAGGGRGAKPIRLAVRDHHRRSLCGKSPVQSEQWCCWISRGRLISGSAEIAAIRAIAALNQRPRKHAIKTAFGPEDTAAMTAAFEEVLKRLNVADREAPMAISVAKRIVRLAKRGERNPTRLTEGVISSFRAKPIPM
jgi:hypothetical protein